MQPQQQPTNNPTPTSAYPPSSHPTNTSTSPTRSVKPWVSMDENSPRIMYQPPKSEDAAAAPGTPINNEYHPSTTTHPPSYDYYGYNNPHPYSGGRSQEYSTPPAAYHASSPSWDGGAVVPKTTFSPQLGPTPHGVPPPTTPMCTDGTNAKKHQFRKGMRGMHSDPVILRKKFSWRNYPEVSIMHIL
eukprot:scaffold101613_cov43-Cyclotella_meneghiniana.AAC.1